MSDRLKLLLIVSVLTLSGSFQFGYLLIIPNSAKDTFQTFLNESFFERHGMYLFESEFTYLWPLFLNQLAIGGLLGSLLLKPLTEKFGRKNSFYIVIIFQVVGYFASAVAYFGNAWELLVLGRLISGIGVGISMGLQPMYFSEISPKPILGLLNGMTGTSLELGFLFGSIVALPTLLGSNDLWHWLFWIEFPLLFCSLAIIPFLQESPKFLLASRNNSIAARKSLIFFFHKDIEEDIQEIEEEINSEKKVVPLTTIFKRSYLRLGLMLGIVTFSGCLFSGIGAISFYSTNLFIKAGIPEHVAPFATVAVTFNAFLAALISSFVVDRIGRRPLIISTLLVLAGLNIIYVISSFVGKQLNETRWSGYICVADTFIFTFIFGLGPAVVMWFITAELMPQNARSSALAFVQAFQWVLSVLIIFLFHPLENAIGEWSFFMFIIPLVAVSIYLYYKLPETKNKTTLEIIMALGYVEDDYLSPAEKSLIN